MATYTYSIQNDFPNHKVATDRLAQEVRNSGIVTALEAVNTLLDVCDVVFKADLSLGDKVLLDGLIAAHQGEPIPADTFKTQSDGALLVAQVGRLEGSEFIITSHNFSDKTTWYPNATEVTDETLTDSGDGLTWNSAHPNWIDLIHGKKHDEDKLSGYDVVVTSDLEEKTMRPPFATDWTEGGDYYVDFASGKVVFQASQAGKTVRATYDYATTSEWYLTPGAGEAYYVDEAEVQFTTDVVMKDSLRYEARGYVIVFAPELAESNGGPLPDYSKIVLAGSTFKSFAQILDEARGSYPSVAAVGGSNLRALQHTLLIMPFVYKQTRCLRSDYGMDLVVRLENNVPLEGERGTITFYGIMRTLSDQ